MKVPEVRYAKATDGAIIAYQVVGDGPVDLVYLEGFVSHLVWMWHYPPWAHLLRRIASFARLIVVDRRGVGLSDRFSPGDLPSLEVLVEDLTAVLNEVGSTDAVIAGFQEGGHQAALFAASHPERTRALILYAMNPGGLATEDYPFGWTDEEWDKYIDGVAIGWGTREWFRKNLVESAPSVLGDEHAFDWGLQLTQMAASPTGAAALMSLYRATDIRPILSTIRVPTLVLHRADDPGESFGVSRYVADRVPAGTLIELPGHDTPEYLGPVDAVADAIEAFVTGRPAARPPDRILLTVLFTDIVGSTERAAAIGDAAWKEVLAAHTSRAKSEIERYRGTYVHTTGDGLLATFDGPARAVRCAQAIVRCVRDLGLEVRAGCHTGEVELADEDVQGLAVHVGARVAGLAEPSQVLVSSTVKNLVAGSGLAFDDAGEHELKGVPDRWHLYGVVSETA